MLKRILIVAVWVMVAFNATYLTVRIARDRDLFPSKGVDAGASRFKEAVELIRENYAGGPDIAAGELTDKALEQMLKSLDPHSEYLTRKRFDTVQNDLRGEFGGIGVQIELKDNRVTVIAPIAGTPGERAGILRGDQIIKVNGDLIQDPPLNNAIEKLRGRPGTKVDVTLHRPSTGADIDVTITREIIRQDTIRSAQILEPGIGYIHLTQFNERSGLEFREALERLEREGMRALVLDLRNNPGGLLNVAVEVAQPFFDRGELVVYTQGRTNGTRQNYTAQGDSARRDAQQLFQSDAPTAMLLAEHAINRDTFNPHAWRLLAQGVSTGVIDQKQGNVLAARLMKDLANHPDLTLDCLDKFMVAIPLEDISERQKIFNKAYGLYAKRPDLQIRLRLIQCAELVAAEKPVDALQISLQTCTANAKEGGLILALVEYIVMFSKESAAKNPKFPLATVKKLLSDIEDDFPQKRGDDVSKAYTDFKNLVMQLE
jgi:C-terminal peptidase prc